MSGSKSVLLHIEVKSDGAVYLGREFRGYLMDAVDRGRDGLPGLRYQRDHTPARWFEILLEECRNYNEDVLELEKEQAFENGQEYGWELARNDEVTSREVKASYND